MFNLIKKVFILIMSTISVYGYCLLLQNCYDYCYLNIVYCYDYMTFAYKIGVNKCIGS